MSRLRNNCRVPSRWEIFSYLRDMKHLLKCWMMALVTFKQRYYSLNYILSLFLKHTLTHIPNKHQTAYFVFQVHTHTCCDTHIAPTRTYTNNYLHLIVKYKSVMYSAVVVFLFLAGLWFTEAIINGPNFYPKLTLAAPTIGYSVSCCVSCWLAQQESVDR